MARTVELTRSTRVTISRWRAWRRLPAGNLVRPRLCLIQHARLLRENHSTEPHVVEEEPTFEGLVVHLTENRIAGACCGDRE